METRDVLAKLDNTRAPINKLIAPPASGVYAIFLKEGARLHLENLPSSGLIYVGTSSNLSSREYDTHFASGKTGFSTLRRSIGALLKRDLKLKAVPRGTGNSLNNFRNYCFTTDGEERLTTWMRENLEIGVCSVSGDYNDVEAELIAELKPVLCLNGWPNPVAAYIKNLRKKCVEEAQKEKR
ncbi:MAG: hypothetical protein K6T65_03760 [Peptococcaceae bacterium]|nr:hypothetical protein [Peptococcaceae bacterium]